MISITNNKIPYIIAVITMVVLVITNIPTGIGYDEGIWLYQARLWVHDGMPPYQFSIENKTPGIFYIFAISYYFFQNSIWFPKLLGIIITALSALVIYEIGKKLFNTASGILAEAVFGLFACTYFVDANWIQHPETYIVFFSSLAFYFLIKNRNNADGNISNMDAIIAGLMMGTSIIFKQIAIFTAFAFFLYILYSGRINNNSNIKVIKLLIFYCLGIFISYIILSIPVLLSHVSLYAYVKNSWIILLDGRSTLKPSLLKRITGLVRVLSSFEMKFMVVSFIFLLVNRKSFNKAIFFGLLIWFILDVLGAFSTGTYYSHQLRQILPSFSIFSGFLLYRIQTKFNLKFAYVFAFMFFIMFPFFNFALLAHFYNKGHAKDEKQGVALGIWLHQNSSENDAIFIWGGELNTRALVISDRRSPSKYFDLEFFGNQKSLLEFKTEFLQKKPLYFLIPVETPENMAYLPIPGWLTDLVREEYKLSGKRYGYYVYKQFSASKQAITEISKTGK